MHSIKELINVTGQDREIGFKRLGRVLSGSMRIQKISTRDFEAITKKLFGIPLNKDTVVRLQKGNTLNPSLDTYRRMAPMCFRTRYFETTDSDPVGTPIFEFKDKYEDDQKRRFDLTFASTVAELPDLAFRYQDYRELIAVVKGDVPVKQTYKDLVKR